MEVADGGDGGEADASCAFLCIRSSAIDMAAYAKKSKESSGVSSGSSSGGDKGGGGSSSGSEGGDKGGSSGDKGGDNGPPPDTGTD